MNARAIGATITAGPWRSAGHRREAAAAQPAATGTADVTFGPAAGNEKTPAKAAVVGTSRGFEKQRLRSESNRRWRICNPLP